MSFTKAAQEMCLTQPAVSIQVKQLEAHIGLPLFEQIGKKLFLTEAGHELRSVCLDIFARLENLEMSLTQMKGVMHGKLKLAAVTSAQYFVPHLLGAFHRHYPEVEVSLEVTNRNKVLQRLQNNEDDLVLMAQVPDKMKLRSYPFLDNPMIPIGPPEHRLFGQQQLPMEVFSQECFLMREQGSGSRKAIEDHLRENNVTLPKTLELGSSETIKQGIMAGLGLSILSRHSVGLELATGCLVELDISGFPIIRSWCVVHHEEKLLSPVAKAFLDFVLNNEESVMEMLHTRFIHR